MKKKLIAGVLAAALCSGAFAAEHSHEVYGELGVGGYFNHSYSQTGPAVSGTAGYAFNKNLSAQLNLSYLTNDQTTALAEGIWNLPNSSKLTPYVALGGGYMHLTTNAFGVDAGAGVKYELASNAYASLNYRYLQSFGSKTPNGSMITIGLGLYFGGQGHDLSGVDTAMSSDQAQREDHYHQKYVLPSNVMECQTSTPAVTRESIGCYTVNGDKVTMHLDAKFAYDSYALDSKAKKAIDDLLAFMQQYNIKKIELRGYASQGKTGPAYAAYNHKLSVKRAQAVKSYLVSQNVDASDIDVVGFGYTRPLVPNTTKENQAINQRVETSVPVPLR
ncbi:OmpA family protein [Facilibium subflavum]|uniref:OmpA family protein n=1 Tax=Facilibium subflavum TaxID=2219058 RepID=UPI000E65B1F3|nr:OmpA family protein [Facilibium subflavum]